MYMGPLKNFDLIFKSAFNTSDILSFHFKPLSSKLEQFSCSRVKSKIKLVLTGLSRKKDAKNAFDEIFALPARLEN